MLRSARSTIQNVTATALMAAAAVAVTYPASAQEVKTAANTSADCASRYDAKTRDVGCAAERFIERMNKESQEARRDAAEADRRGAEADRRGSEADVQSACLDTLIGYMSTPTKVPATGEVITKAWLNSKAEGGKVTGANACQTRDTVNSILQGRRAEAPSPQVN